MGGCNSMCIPRKNPNLCSENHARMPKLRISKRNYSTTFNVNEIQKPMDVININNATEEELMTLPGINRPTAHAIVDYRQQIGGFKQVEDLALVSGIGATKLESLRMEICVSKPKSKPASLDGSVTGLDDGVKRQLSKASSSHRKRVNINTANVFQLHHVKGIELPMAQNIVLYREKKGLFKSIDDLLRVKGVGPAILGMIRQELCLDDDAQSNSADSGIGPAAYPVNPPDSASTTSDQVSQLVQMSGPLSSSSTRPDIEAFAFKKGNRHVVRIASWNIQQLTAEKIKNPGVKEVICMTLLENGIGLMAFQELANKDVLQMICDELNNPTLPSVGKWRGARGHWECISSSKPTGRMFQGMEYNGFVYDTDQEISLLSSSLVESKEDGERKFVRKPFVAHFQIRKVDIALCSVHLKATGLKGEDLDESKLEATTIHKLAQAIHTKLVHEKDVMIMGDFNMTPDCEEFDDLKEKGFKNMIPSDLFTNISSKNPKGSQAYDNIWVSPQTHTYHTGERKVIREGLTSPWIPDGWSWGGVVSDHCPIYCEFYAGGADLDQGDNIDIEGIQLQRAKFSLTASES